MPCNSAFLFNSKLEYVFLFNSKLEYDLKEILFLSSILFRSVLLEMLFAEAAAHIFLQCFKPEFSIAGVLP